MTQTDREQQDFDPVETLKELVAAHPEKRITDPRSLMGNWPAGDDDLDAFLTELSKTGQDAAINPFSTPS